MSKVMLALDAADKAEKAVRNIELPLYIVLSGALFNASVYLGAAIDKLTAIVVFAVLDIICQLLMIARLRESTTKLAVFLVGSLLSAAVFFRLLSRNSTFYYFYKAFNGGIKPPPYSGIALILGYSINASGCFVLMLVAVTYIIARKAKKRETAEAEGD